MRSFINKFWRWYERHLTLNTAIAAGLFLLQIVHLYWLFTDIILLRLTGKSWFYDSDVLKTVIAVVDYTEIPAIISTSLLYINLMRKKFKLRYLLFFAFINSQWIHLFWLTDEVVVATFTQRAIVGIPVLLSWIAILIDYLELPVIADTSRRLIQALRQQKNLKTINDILKDT